jgi:hypothetical protein
MTSTIAYPPRLFSIILLKTSGVYVFHSSNKEGFNMKRITLSLAFLLLCLTIASAVPQRAVLDFDGDNKTDYAVMRADMLGTETWYIQQSAAGFLGLQWGTGSDGVVPADYDGDGKWDISVWRSGTPAYFYIFQSRTGTLRVVQFGTSGDDPLITQDFDGDGIADPAVVRKENGMLTWYIQRSLLGFTAVTFGDGATDLPIRGDYDGDGKADEVVYRINPPANTFYVLRSSDGTVQGQAFGAYITDYIFPADFDGDGKTDYSVWRGANGGTNGAWYWLNSSDGSFHALLFGINNSMGTGDLPVPGDYDGDGKTDQAVWRTSAQATFYVNGSTVGFLAFPFGKNGDLPPAYALQAR